jgi:hypothetical protein
MKTDEMKTKREVKWEENFKLLLKYKEINSTTYIPFRLRESDNPELKILSIWCYTQRECFKKGSLQKERYKKLKSIGFNFGKNDVDLDKRVQDLINFKAKYGHFNVPYDFAEFSNLGKWVSIIRNRFNSEECINKLNSIGFDWDLVDKVWLKKYFALSDYKEKHGNFIIKNKQLHSELYKWMLALRKAKKSGNKEFLSETKINLLNDINFLWDEKESNWDKNYFKLKAFIELNGHCLVPVNYKENQGLYQWLLKIRKNRDKLSKDKIELLDSIGFEWDRKKLANGRIKKKLGKLLTEYNSEKITEKNEIIGK